VKLLNFDADRSRTKGSSVAGVASKLGYTLKPVILKSVGKNKKKWQIFVFPIDERKKMSRKVLFLFLQLYYKKNKQGKRILWLCECG
jgi:hypothetical protein